MLKPELESLLEFEDEQDYETATASSPLFRWLSSGQTEFETKTRKKKKSRSNFIYRPPSESQIVSQAIAAGERNENTLSDLVFHKRHPELGGQPLYQGMPSFSSLSSEWITIRNTIVRPLLASPSPPTSVEPAPPTIGRPMKKANLQNILNAISRKGYRLFTRPSELNIVGVRKDQAVPNSFDDSINVFYKDNQGRWQFKSNPATTDPGTFYLLDPLNDAGTAIVVPGQYINSHQIGLHKSSYTALVQRGNLTIIRDANLDNRLDFNSGQKITGSSYGINIHRALSSGTATKVDQFSAGCQVFANSDDFAHFMSLCQQHSNLYGNNFTYTLFLESQL